MTHLLTNGGSFPIIKTHSYYAHVHSDNAMLDSGFRTDVTVWLEKYNITALRTYGEIGPAMTLSDLDSVTVDKAIAFDSGVKWVKDTTYNVYKADLEASPSYYLKNVKPGDTVEVFKGVKAPRDQYTVRYVGNGQYGPYFLLDAKGPGTKDTRFVNTSNCRTVAKPVQYPQMPSDQLALFVSLAKLGSGYESLQTEKQKAIILYALADLLEEGGDARSEHVRNYAKFCVDPDTKVDTYSLFNGDLKVA